MAPTITIIINIVLILLKDLFISLLFFSSWSSLSQKTWRLHGWCCVQFGNFSPCHTIKIAFLRYHLCKDLFTPWVFVGRASEGTAKFDNTFPVVHPHFSRPVATAHLLRRDFFHKVIVPFLSCLNGLHVFVFMSAKWSWESFPANPWACKNGCKSTNFSRQGKGFCEIFFFQILRRTEY